MPGVPGIKLIGQAPSFLEVLQQIANIASIDAPVLIEGETGTGKELIARAMHYSGPRCAMPFIPANCGALPESLIENEFFGHQRGAYTGALGVHPGLIAEARGGTLFLDEVDALPLRGQVALLRFLQDLCYRPLGATREERADVRIISATSVNLDHAVQQKQFRPDLLFRLKIFSVSLPALRDRPGDAELLANHFLRIYRKQYQLAEQGMSNTDIAWLRSYSWPGNVRELESLIHRALVQSRGKPCIALQGGIAPHRHDAAHTAPAAAPLPRFRPAKAAAVQAFERSFIERAMRETHGNVSAAARLCGKERRSFGKLMKKHGFTKHQFQDPL